MIVITGFSTRRMSLFHEKKFSLQQYLSEKKDKLEVDFNEMQYFGLKITVELHQNATRYRYYSLPILFSYLRNPPLPSRLEMFSEVCVL